MTPAEIRGARQKAGLTQQQVADALGVSRLTVVNWESGKHTIDRFKVEPLMRVLDALA